MFARLLTESVVINAVNALVQTISLLETKKVLMTYFCLCFSIAWLVSPLLSNEITALPSRYYYYYYLYYCYNYYYN